MFAQFSKKHLSDLSKKWDLLTKFMDSIAQVQYKPN